MTLSELGAKFIAFFEGFSAKPYVDPASGGEPITIGYGTTVYASGKKVTMADAPITKVQALAELMDHVNKHVSGYLNKTFPNLSQHQFDALASFAYNLGVGNLKTSSLQRDILAKASPVVIANDFAKWNKAGGKVMNGLTKRRAAESNLYNTATYIS